MRATDAPPRPLAPSLVALARLFLKLGVTAFGGPAAHIALMEDEVVRRRRWLSREQFLDLVGATSLIPGPNSTELAMHIGYARAGSPGLVVSGICFIVPAALIVTALAWVYVRAGAMPQVEGILYGIKPVVLAVILQALWRLTPIAIRTPTLALVAALASVGAALGVNEIAVLAVAALITWLLRRRGRPRASSLDASTPSGHGFAPLPFAALASGVASGTGAGIGFGLWPLFAFFLKVGSVLFGSGYVLLAFLRSGLVEGRGWLTEGQLLDAVAIGQVTPGPVFTTATFIGYVLGGGAGALVATVGIFLPAFFFVAVSAPRIARLRRSAAAAAVLDGVNAASLALMAVVTVQLGAAALVDIITTGLAVLSAVMLLRFNLNSALLVVSGAVAGLLAQAIRAG